MLNHVRLCNPMDYSPRLLSPWNFPGKNTRVVVENTGMESREEPQGVKAQRRAGVEKLQPRLRVWIYPMSNFESCLNAPPTLLYFRGKKRKVEKADVVGS